MQRDDRAGSRRNALAREKSPYLLAHSTNPVNWYPWGDEAFELARREDKPIFLSIGYSTCHWCHVMAEESFEDPEVAELINDAFIAIKVDREERPDIDHVYITACQLMGSNAGWPLTIIMTPDGDPFFAATYVPRESRPGLMGLLELVPNVKRLWAGQRGEVRQAARAITSLLAGEVDGAGPAAASAAAKAPCASEERLDSSLLDETYRCLVARFDAENGGFGEAPKFPTPHNLVFLLRHWQRAGDGRALAMVQQTLDAMRRGGLYDHLGFGFHRYSTDRRWRVPHFEKMLYDQALVAMAYTEAFEATGEAAYRTTAEEVSAYVLGDMTSPEGGFYSAEDADSEGEEGKFYLWTQAEVTAALAPDEADLFCRVFGVTAAGNAAGPGAGLPQGSNVLYMTQPFGRLSAALGLSESELRERLERARQAMTAVRRQRVRPHKDDKILADWNGLEIAALAKAARAFGEPRYGDAARQATDFVLATMRSADGRLLHRWRGGEAAIAGMLSDYAFVVWGLIELYETTSERAYLDTALELNSIMLEHFWDAKGGLYFASDDTGYLPVRMKETYDGAMPSGNSVALANLVTLARLAGDSGLEERAAGLAGWLARRARSVPLAHVHFMTTVDAMLRRDQPGSDGMP